MKLISPTGNSIRIQDDFGSGLFNAPRGNQKHNGVDFICKPGQEILSPIEGKIIRIAFPYANNLDYSGVLMENDSIQIKLFYFLPDKNKIGKKVKQGEKIGIAQDISRIYNSKNKKMIPHLHLQIESIDPLVLL